jgi:[ribosomal protein S5]-alanine N-acetyltransferase
MNLDSQDIWTTFPTIETQRLLLREITLDDAEDVYRVYSDADVMEYWGGPPHRFLTETRQMITAIASDFQLHEGIRWAVTLKGFGTGNGKFIGSCGHWRLMKRHYRSEIGYELARQHWGRGIMAEAVEAICQFGFKRMGLHSIEAQVDPANVRSVRLLARVRFRREGYLRENFFVNGRFHDSLLFARLVSD